MARPECLQRVHVWQWLRWQQLRWAKMPAVVTRMGAVALVLSTLFLAVPRVVDLSAHALAGDPTVIAVPTDAATAPIGERVGTAPVGGYYGYNVTIQNANDYAAAIQNCDTPSLECLVRNVFQFTAIEFVNNVFGKATGNNAVKDPTLPIGSLSTTRSLALSADDGIIAGGFKIFMLGLQNKPASTRMFVADALDNAGFATPAYAQGLGYASLNPVMGLWKLFRNVAYFFFIGLFIVIGFIIMFRQKISGSAAVTAQQALPNIIIALILVSFSYAISGFMIDLMYLSMYLIVGLLSLPGATGMSEGTQQIGLWNATGQDLITMNIIQLGAALVTDVGSLTTTSDFVEKFLVNLSGNQANWATSTLSFFGGLTLSVILAIGVLIGMVKLFFELLKSYASIIMSVVFAPLYLMMGAIPGKNTFTPWLKNLIGNLAAFPTVLLFVMIYVIFTQSITPGSTGGFLPPYLLGNGSSSLAGSILGFAIILALPEIVKEIKKKMGATEGGFGWMIANKAMDASKESWNKGVNLGPLGRVSGKGVANLAWKVPVGAAGGVIGYNQASDLADNAGLTGRARAGSLAAGTGIGFGLAANLPRVVRQVTGGAYRQTRDSLIQLKTDEMITKLTTAQDKAGVMGERNVAAANKEVQASVQPDLTGAQSPNLGQGLPAARRSRFRRNP